MGVLAGKSLITFLAVCACSTISCPLDTLLDLILTLHNLTPPLIDVVGVGALILNMPFGEYPWAAASLVVEHVVVTVMHVMLHQLSTYLVLTMRICTILTKFALSDLIGVVSAELRLVLRQVEELLCLTVGIGTLISRTTLSQIGFDGA